jgi:hypothetical protein
MTVPDLREQALALAVRYGDISDRLEAASAEADGPTLERLLPELGKLAGVAEALLAAAERPHNRTTAGEKSGPAR